MIANKYIYVLIGCFLLFTTVSAGLEHIENLKEDIATAQLRADSLEAIKDTTRLKELKALEDSVDYYERRVIQVELKKDSIDEELERTSRVRTDIEAQVDSLENIIASSTVTEDSTNVRTAVFNLYEKPYTVDAKVTVPPAPDSATIDLGIKLDPILLSTRITCSDNNLRRASLGVSSPDWVTIQITNVEQSPEVCNPQLYEPDLNWFEENSTWLSFTSGTLITLFLLSIS